MDAFPARDRISPSPDERLKILDYCIIITAFEAQNMNEKSSSVHMAQELEPQPLLRWAPSMSPGMSAMTIRSSPGVQHAEIGRERCEGIVGDLWLRVGDGGQDARLADIRQSHEPTSAMSRSSRRSITSSPGLPCSQKRGALRAELAK